MHYAYPLLTFIDDNPDFNASDSRRALIEGLKRQAIVDAIFSGETQLDELLECICDQGGDVDFFIREASAGIDLVLAGKAEVEGLEELRILGRHRGVYGSL